MRQMDPAKMQRISVVFEKRLDGGLRVSSPDVPGFRLSHSNPALVTADIVPALETILAETIGRPVRVRMAAKELMLPDETETHTKVEYVSSVAA